MNNNMQMKWDKKQLRFRKVSNGKPGPLGSIFSDYKDNEHEIKTLQFILSRHYSRELNDYNSWLQLYKEKLRERDLYMQIFYC